MNRFFPSACILFVADGLTKLGETTDSRDEAVKTAKGGESDNALPDVADLLPSTAYADMKSKVAELAKQMAREQQEKKQALERLKKNYEQQLIGQLRENSMVERTNKQLATRAAALKDSNVPLRRRAAEFVKANDRLQSELTALKVNLSFAQEFLEESLVVYQQNSSEVQVLAELADEDSNAREASRKLALFDGDSEVSLLQAVGDAAERHHEDIVDNLAASFAMLSSEAKTSETALTEAFQKQLATAKDAYADLLKEQASINATIAATSTTHSRLATAVDYLSKVHKDLTARLQGVRAYVNRLGNIRQTQAIDKVSKQESVEKDRENNGGETVRSTKQRTRPSRRKKSSGSRKTGSSVAAEDTAPTDGIRGSKVVDAVHAASVSTTNVSADTNKRTLQSFLPNFFR
jgi:3-dehydroquinate dehydratase